MTPGGIEPATFRFVAHLNHCATAVPLSYCRLMEIRVCVHTYDIKRLLPAVQTDTNRDTYCTKHYQSFDTETTFTIGTFPESLSRILQ